MFATKTKCYKSQAKECAKSGHRWQGAVRNIVVARHVGVGGMAENSNCKKGATNNSYNNNQNKA